MINGIEYIEATVEDYEIVYQMAPKILLAAVDELSRWGRELLSFFQEQTRPVDLSRKTLRELLVWPDKRLRSALEELTAQEHLVLYRGPVGNVFYYKLNPEGAQNSDIISLGLLTPCELRRLIQAPTR